MSLLFRVGLGLLAAAILAAAPGTAMAQDGPESEDSLYAPSTGAPDPPPPAPGGAKPAAVSPPGPAPIRLSEVILAPCVYMPLAVPSRFGDTDGLPVGATIAWRRFVGGSPSERGLFAGFSIAYATAAFTNDSANLTDLDPRASSTIGRLETGADYVLAVGQLGTELWGSSPIHVVGWLGAGIGIERRSEEFTAQPALTFDDSGHRSVAVGEVGIALSWVVGTFSFEGRLSALATLGDEPPLGLAMVIGVGIGVGL